MGSKRLNNNQQIEKNFLAENKRLITSQSEFNHKLKFGRHQNRRGSGINGRCPTPNVSRERFMKSHDPEPGANRDEARVRSVVDGRIDEKQGKDTKNIFHVHNSSGNGNSVSLCPGKFRLSSTDCLHKKLHDIVDNDKDRMKLNNDGRVPKPLKEHSISSHSSDSLPMVDESNSTFSYRPSTSNSSLILHNDNDAMSIQDDVTSCLSLNKLDDELLMDELLIKQPNKIEAECGDKVRSSSAAAEVLFIDNDTDAITKRTDHVISPASIDDELDQSNRNRIEGEYVIAQIGNEIENHGLVGRRPEETGRSQNKFDDFHFKSPALPLLSNFASTHLNAKRRLLSSSKSTSAITAGSYLHPVCSTTNPTLTRVNTVQRNHRRCSTSPSATFVSSSSSSTRNSSLLSLKSSGVKNYRPHQRAFRAASASAEIWEIQQALRRGEMVEGVVQIENLLNQSSLSSSTSSGKTSNRNNSRIVAPSLLGKSLKGSSSSNTSLSASSSPPTTLSSDKSHLKTTLMSASNNDGIKTSTRSTLSQDKGMTTPNATSSPNNRPSSSSSSLTISRGCYHDVRSSSPITSANLNSSSTSTRSVGGQSSSFCKLHHPHIDVNSDTSVPSSINMSRNKSRLITSTTKPTSYNSIRHQLREKPEDNTDVNHRQKPAKNKIISSFAKINLKSRSVGHHNHTSNLVKASRTDALNKDANKSIS